MTNRAALPSAESEGGRRLYTDRDMILLHQILSLKHLGFSLDAIKNHLTALETPADVAAALTEQASVLRRKNRDAVRIPAGYRGFEDRSTADAISGFLKVCRYHREFADENESYWLIKYFDDKTLDHIRNHFDKDSGLRMIATLPGSMTGQLSFRRRAYPLKAIKAGRLPKNFGI